MPKINGKQKGSRAERVIAKLFSEWWGSEFARTPMSGGFHTAKFREDWNAAADLVTPDDEFPFSVECKWRENWKLEQLFMSDKCPVWSWWQQTVNETPEGKIPLLVFKRNNIPWFYMMHEEHDIVGGPRIYTFDFNDDRVVVGLLKDLHQTQKSDWVDCE